VITVSIQQGDSESAGNAIKSGGALDPLIWLMADALTDQGAHFRVLEVTATSIKLETVYRINGNTVEPTGGTVLTYTFTTTEADARFTQLAEQLSAWLR